MSDFKTISPKLDGFQEGLGNSYVALKGTGFLSWIRIVWVHLPAPGVIR